MKNLKMINVFFLGILSTSAMAQNHGTAVGGFRTVIPTEVTTGIVPQVDLSDTCKSFQERADKIKIESCEKGTCKNIAKFFDNLRRTPMKATQTQFEAEFMMNSNEVVNLLTPLMKNKIADELEALVKEQGVLSEVVIAPEQLALSPQGPKNIELFFAEGSLANKAKALGLDLKPIKAQVSQGQVIFVVTGKDQVCDLLSQRARISAKSSVWISFDEKARSERIALLQEYRDLIKKAFAKSKNREEAMLRAGLKVGALVGKTSEFLHPVLDLDDQAIAIVRLFGEVPGLSMNDSGMTQSLEKLFPSHQEIQDVPHTFLVQ